MKTIESRALAAMAEYESLECIEDYEERKAIFEMSQICLQIAGEQKAGAHILDVIAKYQRMYGLRGLKQRYYKWAKHGKMGLADGRKMKRPRETNPFYRDFKTYCDNNKNVCTDAHRAMMRDFRAGKQFSFGTWRDVWRLQRPDVPVPPWCPSEFTPHGMGYAQLDTLYRSDPERKLALLWNRQGMFAASKHLPPVLRSRVGLPVGAVYMSDDVWHNIDVYAQGIKGIFQPLEFATLDVASAFKVGSLMKPRQLVTDPKTGREVRDNLKQQQFRFEVANIMCCTGFHKDGVTWIGEHNTTRLGDRVLARIASVPGWGHLFRWSMSGIMNMPAHKGLPMGDGGGNPRMKALVECYHNIMHNATAGLPGNRGRDAAHMHESQSAVVRYSKHMIAQAERLDPALVPLRQLPILEWKTYLQYFRMIEDEIMDRTDHNLEGWGDRETIDYRLDANSNWLPASMLLDVPPEKVAAIQAVISTDPANLMRKRKLSRREVWAKGRKDLVKWPLFDAPAFLDPGDRKSGAKGDFKTATVGQDGTISFTDAMYYPGERKVYLAQYRDRGGLPHRLCPGDKVNFYWIPLGELANQIWITDEDGCSTLGMAPALKTAAWADPESIKVAMGQREHQIAELMADTRARHAESAVARLAAEGVNRALLAAAKEARSIGAKPSGDGYSFDELNAAEMPPAESAETAEVSYDTNADALDFIAELNEV